ncbi:hypothetical protein [Mesorhizobium sp. CO1-1-8]|uniref:hypothetical protein n=1 Tax=Mesorhizobium sp. CO1-1-8 TaxID=2876631 RepID=UPI001CD175F9|nr:hypothetical protein [Mesorhizobium sp. CO1-1-8]MBZ9776591.1 hypothetical protein [Mesorhizobium sp. CO1-1-8]
MRTVFTSLFAFIISGFAGGMVAQPNLATVLVHWLFVRWRVGSGSIKAQVGA